MIRLAPSIPGEHVFGLGPLEGLFARELPEALDEATHILGDQRGVLILRYPLPRMHGAPRTAVPERVIVKRYAGATLSEMARARFTAPRSESSAEREWNLLCHLRAAGVSTPEPLAVGRASAGLFARRSFLITRELAGMRTLASWRSEPMDARAAAHMARAVGEFLARLFRSRTRIRGLIAERIAVAVPRALTAGGEECGDAPAGTRFAKLPEVALLECRGGRIVRELDWDARVEMLFELGASLPLSADRFFLRIVHAALARGVRDRAHRAALARRLAACKARERSAVRV